MADSLDTAQVRELVAGNRRLLTGTNPFPTREEWVGGALDALAASNDALSRLVEERDRLAAPITYDELRTAITHGGYPVPHFVLPFIAAALNKARGLE